MLELCLYNRVGCHLCEDMWQQLQALQSEYDFSIKVIDVDKNADLCQRYGDKVPVLIAGQIELCHYFLDEAGLRHYLDQHSTND